MPLDTQKLQKQFTKVGGSKVMFQWKFKEELVKTIDLLALQLEKDIPSIAILHSLDTWANNIKIRVEYEGEDKLINAIFRYSHNDEKFGHIHIEITLSSHSEKTKSHFMGKFSVIDHKGIEKALMKDIMVCIKH